MRNNFHDVLIFLYIAQRQGMPLFSC